MTIEQLNYLLRKELYAIKNHKDNIDRIKKEYFDSNYGLKEGDKIRILHEAGDEMIGFLKKVEVCEDGDLYLTIQKQNEKGDKGRGTWNMYLSSKSIKIEKCVYVMRVLSLFDGMSCGQIALKEIGITPEVYYASEIDKFAIKQTQLNFPNTIQVGDVRDLNVEDLGRIDLILAGSPCTDMSFSGKRKGLSTVEGIEVKSLNEYLELKKQGFEFAGQSYLFWEFIRILNDVRKTNPDVLFLLENVKMGKKWEPVFDDAIGCKGNHINSALVSAQVRKRIYWTNIQDGIIPQPEDEGLTISDIAEYEVDEKYYLSEKVLNNLAFHLKRNHDKGNCYGANIKTKDEKSNTVTVKGKYTYDLICVAMRGRNPEKPTCRESGLKTVQMIEFKNDGKSNCLTTVQKDNLIFQIPRGFNKGGFHEDKAPTLSCNSYDRNNFIIQRALHGDFRIRRLTPTECSRLQTVPNWYKWECSETQQYKMLGNGWTIKVIEHILKRIKES